MRIPNACFLSLIVLNSCSKFYPKTDSFPTSNKALVSQDTSVAALTAKKIDVPKTDSTLKGVSLLHSLPKIPNQEGGDRFFLTSFANKTDDKINVELMKKIPAVEMILEGNNKTDGKHYCFSNDSNPQGVECARPPLDSEVLSQIKGLQESSSARQPLYINALQFIFKSSDKGASSSKVVFEGAIVEKSPLSFNYQTGELNPVAEKDKIKISYGSSCKLSEENTVGFDSLGASSGKEFYLSGLWSFARTKRKAFAETQDFQEADRCADEDTKSDWYCNLFVDKAHVWYAALFPLLFQHPVTGERGVGHRQFPSQITTASGIEGSLLTEQVTFGLYSTAADAKGFVKTPEIGKVDAKGEIIKDWEKTFITSLCLKGYRLENNNSGEQSKIPFMEALRVELRSPYLKVLR